MYAVVTTGGRQYRVSPGDTIDVEKLTGAVGDTVALTNVHLVGQGAEVTIGVPAVAGVRVEAQITAQKRGKKKSLSSNIGGARAIAANRGIGNP